MFSLVPSAFSIIVLIVSCVLTIPVGLVVGSCIHEHVTNRADTSDSADFATFVYMVATVASILVPVLVFAHGNLCVALCAAIMLIGTPAAGLAPIVLYPFCKELVRFGRKIGQRTADIAAGKPKSGDSC